MPSQDFKSCAPPKRRWVGSIPIRSRFILLAFPPFPVTPFPRIWCTGLNLHLFAGLSMRKRCKFGAISRQFRDAHRFFARFITNAASCGFLQVEAFCLFDFVSRKFHRNKSPILAGLGYPLQITPIAIFPTHSRFPAVVVNSQIASQLHKPKPSYPSPSCAIICITFWIASLNALA